MATVEQSIPLLEEGQRLTRAEFLRRWDAMPDLKHAELLGGIVYMASPLSRPHALLAWHAGRWLGDYVDETPGCEGEADGTWLMPDEGTPQPDMALFILPERGGQSTVEGNYFGGAPELVVEVSVSSTARDLGIKLNLYRAAGVLEYLVVVEDPPEIRWHRLVNGRYELLEPGSDGIWKSVVFPGLWLDGAGLLALDRQRVRAALQQGLASKEHADFVTRLRQART